jgi:hypothetical protein
MVLITTSRIAIQFQRERGVGMEEEEDGKIINNN